MHFISGLPRSGSTLLAAILRQNPIFHASIMSPTGMIVTDAVTSMGPANEAERFICDHQRQAIIRGIFLHFYAHYEGDVVFDNNRRWCNNLAVIDRCFPAARVICCVRSPAMIADSFERLFVKNGMRPSVVYGGQANKTPYERLRAIMQDQGVLGFALAAFEAAWYGPFKHKLHVINYTDLVSNPRRQMALLHEALKEPPFSYDFENVKQVPGAKEFDEDVATPGLHTVSPIVRYEPRTPALPPSLLNTLPKPFWFDNNPVTKVI